MKKQSKYRWGKRQNYNGKMENKRKKMNKGNNGVSIDVCVVRWIRGITHTRKGLNWTIGEGKVESKVVLSEKKFNIDKNGKKKRKKESRKKMDRGQEMENKILHLWRWNVGGKIEDLHRKRKKRIIEGKGSVKYRGGFKSEKRVL